MHLRVRMVQVGAGFGPKVKAKVRKDEIHTPGPHRDRRIHARSGMNASLCYSFMARVLKQKCVPRFCAVN